MPGESGVRWIEDMWRDLAYGARLLRGSPMFTLVAVLSLALGIGANTAIFSLLDTVMLRSMPVVEPDKLVELKRYFPPYGRGMISYPLFDELRAECRSFAGIFVHSSVSRREIGFGSEEELVHTALASADYYTTLGVPAVVGRVFSRDEERAAVALISYAYWQRRFAGDPKAIGKTFRLHGTVFTIIGVTPKNFFGPIVGKAPEVTFPVKMDGKVRGDESAIEKRHYNWLFVMARLKPGVSREQAQAEVSGLFRRGLELEASKVELRNRKEILDQRIELRSAGNGFADFDLSERYAEPLVALMGVVALVLLIACSNLANLLLARATARRREISVRLAIGAGPGRIIRQLMAESLLLALLGGASGVALALWLSNSLIGMMSAGGPRIEIAIRPDLHVLGFTAAVSAITCLLFGLLPAWQASRVQVNPALKEGLQGGRASVRKGLMVAQVALSLLLVIGAGLFTRTLVNLYSLDSGFDRRGVRMFDVDLSRSGYKGAQAKAAQARIVERLQAMPGVESASFALLQPLSGGGWNGSVRIEGYAPKPEERPDAHFNAISPQHFRTLRAPMLLGRELTAGDSATAPKVVIVNEAFVRRYFAGEPPLGKHVNQAEVVGVVKDMKYRTMRQEIPPTAYWPLPQIEQLQGTYFVRGAMAAPVASAVREIDRTLRIGEVRTLEEHVDNTLVRERLLALLAGFFGAVALIASCLGIYGVTAFQVTRRTNEIGIRIALGGRGPHVVWTVLKEVLGLLLLGVGIGIPAALLLTPLAENLLFGLKPADPMTYMMAATLIGAVAVAAGAIPAMRATRVDPMTALRYE